MLRRNFFNWISTTIIPLLLPKFSRGQATGLSGGETTLLVEVAGVVLPPSLGQARIEAVSHRFIEWTQKYRAGADAGYGYGFPHPRVLPANPAEHYPDQIRQLESAAAAKGSSFSRMDEAGRREIVAAAIEQAGVNKIPQQPNGQHVGSDLLAFFYNSADGQDFLYQAAIKRDDCRGLHTSGDRPARLS